MRIKSDHFGTTATGAATVLHTLRSARGVVVKITNFGGRITELYVPDRNGNSGNIVLGHSSLEPYLRPNEPYFGAIAGRVANRIGGGTFELDGRQYTLSINDGEHTLHGGNAGWDKVVWTSQAHELKDAVALKLSYVSPDGDEGFPGTVHAEATYTLSDVTDELRIDFAAGTDKATPVNLTGHTYFNLAGAGSGDILGHVLTIDADRMTPVNEKLIPTGEIVSVKGTPFDFTTPMKVGDRIAQVPGAPPGGYDHNYVLNSPGGGKPIATVFVPKTGRVMEVFTDQPGVQFYSGNFLNGSIRGLGGTYHKHGGLCLETQHFPDAVHHANFPSTIIRPGENYRQRAAYRFSTRD